MFNWFKRFFSKATTLRLSVFQQEPLVHMALMIKSLDQSNPGWKEMYIRRLYDRPEGGAEVVIIGGQDVNNAGQADTTQGPGPNSGQIPVVRRGPTVH